MLHFRFTLSHSMIKLIYDHFYLFCNAKLLTNNICFFFIFTLEVPVIKKKLLVFRLNGGGLGPLAVQYMYSYIRAYAHDKTKIS